MLERKNKKGEGNSKKKPPVPLEKIIVEKDRAPTKGTNRAMLVEAEGGLDTLFSSRVLKRERENGRGSPSGYPRNKCLGGWKKRQKGGRKHGKSFFTLSFLSWEEKKGRGEVGSKGLHLVLLNN